MQPSAGLILLSAALVCFTNAHAQSTQGLLSGRIVDSVTGAPISGAKVGYQALGTNTTGEVLTNAAGYYAAVALSPGYYRVRVTADRYQAQEVYNLEVAVAARLDLGFRLRPLSDVWEQGQYRSVFLPGSDAVLTFYGPDVDTSRFASFAASRGTAGALETSVSQVIDPALVRELPLAGRDVYTMLVTQAGVTADAGTTRGLGLSANGQRPSATNFLLDGVESNNYLVTGPVTALAPEAVQEYRISTNNFTAEYGRTSGFLANAVTRSGGTSWHGIGYFYLKNDVLNANSFQRNLSGESRPPAKEAQIGYSAAGPVPGSRSLFLSSSLERLRSRGVSSPFDFRLPSATFASNFTAPGSFSRQLLTQFSPPAVSDRNLPTALMRISPPVSINRTLGVQRLDYKPAGSRHQLMGRFALVQLDRPDFIYSPYPDFVSGLEQNNYSVALAWQATLRPALLSEFRFGWLRDELSWDRARPEIPTLIDSLQGTTLPGSLAFYGYRSPNSAWEFNENLSWVRGSHILKFGGGMLFRRTDTALTAGRDGVYQFLDIIDFGLDEPSFLFAPLARRRLPAFQLPHYDRRYRQTQFFLFAQDTLRLTSRLTINFGARYENAGAPANTDAEKEMLLQMGSGSSFGERLASATLPNPESGDQRLYGRDNNDWAARLGGAYDLRGNGATLLRAAYGIFYDRPFDNLWQNVRSNSFTFANLRLPFGRFNYLRPLNAILPGLQGQAFAGDFPDLTVVDPTLRNAYLHSYMFGVQQRISEGWLVEVHGLGSAGRKLVTTDVVNRPGSRPGLGNASRFNPRLFDVSYRANQGSSSYNALSAAARYRSDRAQFHLSYTWSHSIDNQSEALAGDFFDLSFTRATGGAARLFRSAFTRQFDSASDRANSDFDQRHNLVFYSLWYLPSPRRASWLLRDWRIAHIAAFRSGFPYSVLTPAALGGGQALLLNNRADAVTQTATDTPVTGGRRLLNRDAFRPPAAGAIGNTGRNAFSGPGLFSFDLSLARSIYLGESTRITLRADAFNLFNHTNLGQPSSLIGSPDFGISRYGRRGRDTGFPALTPFEETPRQFQLMLRLEF
ncbi:MAG: hypothetical protein FJW20_02505 [Acidimicrobiia bacterium]|nr:hypothetical protein [Acidimicrobiia bacterium]